MVDEKIRMRAVAEVKEGASYKRVAEKYGINSPSAVRYWCIKDGVRSQFIHMKTTDNDVIAVLMERNAAINSEIAKLVDCKNLSGRLNRMVREGKIHYFRIARPNASAYVRKVFPTNYIGMRIYYITKECFVEWVRNQIPRHLQKEARRSVSHMFRGYNISIFAEKDKKKRKYTRKELP